MAHSVLVLFSHPGYEASRVNRALCAAAAGIPDVFCHDLYETYPEQILDVAQEQALVESHDILVFQHPLQWYSCPALMKNWIDSVLTYGWAYGESGNAMRGKYWGHAISTGGAPGIYQRMAYNQFSIAELLRPFEQTATVCGMNYLRPFLTQDASNLSDTALAQQAQAYAAWLRQLAEGELPSPVHTVSGPAADFIPGYYSALNPDEPDHG